VQDKNLLKYLF